MLAAAALTLAIAPAAAQQDFYAGKQITFIVGAGVGGGYDLQARTAARHLGKHIPGNPTVVVQNMPAAGSIAATNFMFSSAPKDGTTIALIQRGMLLSKLTYPAGTRFEIEKFGWIGSLNSETAVTLAWNATSPHRTAKDLFEQELIVGGIVSVDPETTPRLYNSLIGTKFKIVSGYNSTAQIALAIERGEVQGIADWSWSSFKAVRPDWIRDKKVTMLMQGALQNDPELEGAAERARLHQEPVRPPGDGAALHAEDRGAAGDPAAGRAGGAARDAAPRLRRARAGQGVPGRGRQEQGRVQFRAGPGGRQGGGADRRDAARRSPSATPRRLRRRSSYGAQAATAAGRRRPTAVTMCDEPDQFAAKQ